MSATTAVSVKSPTLRRMPAAPPAAAPTAKDASFSVVAVTDLADLEPYIPGWDDLAAAAIEPNVFYESWMLLPALRAYSENAVTVLLVFANHAPQRHGRPLLCGLIPLTLENRRFVSVLSLWSYLHCFLATPLIRAGFGPGVLDAFFDWLAHDRRGAAVLECGRITGDGPFYHLLLKHVNDHRRGLFLAESHARALLRHEGEPLKNGVSRERRKKLRRAEERLAETAAVTYTALADDGDLEVWLAEFLRLEASGWKRGTGTALDCQDADRQFFLDVMRGAFKRRRLMMLALNAGGKPIAHLCNFHAGDGSFAFKVAFDEAFARYSPGALLELENLRRVEARPDIRWMDSCTDASDSLIQHLWLDRRVVNTVLIETRQGWGSFVLAALPLWHWLRRQVNAVCGRRKLTPRGEACR